LPGFLKQRIVCVELLLMMVNQGYQSALEEFRFPRSFIRRFHPIYLGIFLSEMKKLLTGHFILKLAVSLGG